jgi:hypothetical protein
MFCRARIESRGEDACMPTVSYAATVLRAVEHLGGYERVANLLGVNASELVAWAGGSSMPSAKMLLRLSDIILQETNS